MQKLIIASLLAGFAFFGVTAQTSPGNSAFGHSHKKVRHSHHKHIVYHHTDADRRAINVQHRTSVQTITRNTNNTNMQQRDQIKQANVTHRENIKIESHEKGHANGNGHGKDK